MDQFLQFVLDNWLLWLGFMVVLALIVTYESRTNVGGVNLLEPSQVVQLINHDNAIVIDIRDNNAFADGHIIGASHVPSDAVNQDHQKLKKYKDKPIVIVDSAGSQATKAGSTLHQQGFAKIYALKGGIQAWQQAGLPLNRGK